MSEKEESIRKYVAYIDEQLRLCEQQAKQLTLKSAEISTKAKMLLLQKDYALRSLQVDKTKEQLAESRLNLQSLMKPKPSEGKDKEVIVIDDDE